MHSLDRLFDSQRFRSEFRYGPFSRSVPLPDDVKEGDIKATYSDGVLEVPAHLSDQAALPAAPKTPAVVHGPYRRSRPAHTITAVLFQAAGQLLSPGFTAKSGSPRTTCCSRGTGPKAPSPSMTPNGSLKAALERPQQRSPRKCAAGDLVSTQQWTPNGNVEHSRYGTRLR